MSPPKQEGLLLAGGLFCVSAILALRQAKRQKKIQTPSAAVVSSHPAPGIVSSRGEAALRPPIPYLKQFMACLQDPCDPIYNPEGRIALCVAENKLILELIADRFFQAGTATAAFSDPDCYCYNSMSGMPVARKAVAYFLARRFLVVSSESTPAATLERLRPDCVTLSTGAAPLINHIFFLLGEAGDGCLIPAPYYAAFDNDINLVAGVIPCRLEQADPVAGPTVKELEKAYAAAKQRGVTPKFILITNPNNPLGTIYRPDVLRRIVQWARSKQMHTVVDEVYALSTHKQDHAFQSILRVLDNDLGDDVHMLWALSKDFGGSGLRVGVIYSQNERFNEALATLNIFTCVSGPIQYLISEILTDDVFVSSFLEESRRRIVNSYQICTAKLEEMVVPYVPAEAGIFIYIDLSALLPEKTLEWEEKLCDLLFQYAKIVLTPGASQKDSKPGMFRICYTWVTPEVLEIAMERLSKIVAKIRRLDWEDLNESSLSNVL